VKKETKAEKTEVKKAEPAKTEDKIAVVYGCFFYWAVFYPVLLPS